MIRVNHRYRQWLLLSALLIILLSALIYIGNTARQRFDEILETVIIDRNYVSPLPIVNQIQTTLAEVELEVKVFILSQDEKSLENFYNLNFQLLDLFEILDKNRSMYSESKINAIDSLESLAFKRIQNFEDLVQSSDAYRVQKAMNRVENAFAKASEEVNRIYADTLISERGKKRALRRFFATEKQKQIYEARKKKIPAEVVKEFQSNLEDITTVESRKEQELRKKSLEIAASGDIVRRKVDSLVQVISELQAQKSDFKRERIEALATSSRNTVNYTVLAAIVFILIFGYFIYLQIKSTNKYLKATKRASDHALELAHSKEVFIANVSHELRTPLNAIIGFGELNIKERTLQKKQEYDRMIFQSGKHLKSLINDLLDWSKIDSGQFSFEHKPFDLNAVVSEVREIVYGQYKNPAVNFTLRSNIKSNWLVGDPLRLKQILINLLSNAFKFTNNGEVSLSLEDKKLTDNHSQLTIVIRDTGVGISPKHLKKIFNEFEQADSDQKINVEGSGLGLAIVKRLVEHQSGTVHVQSQIDKGSTFKVIIPFEIGHPKLQKQSQRKTNIDQIKLSVLIADDSEYNRKLLLSVLDLPGIQTYEADSGMAALEIMREKLPDLCLFDIKMPMMNGIELAELVHQEWKDNAPIMVAITAANSTDMLAVCRKAGYHTVISKPLDQNELFQLINDLFNIEDIDTEVEQPKKSVPGINLKNLDQIFQDDVAFRNEMLKVFVESMQSEISDLQDAIDTNNVQQIDEITHRCLPSCRHIGADTMVHILQEMRELSKQNNSKSQLIQLSQKISSEFAQVNKIIFDITKE